MSKFIRYPVSYERDLRRERRNEVLRYFAVGLFLVGIGIVLGKLIL